MKHALLSIILGATLCFTTKSNAQELITGSGASHVAPAGKLDWSIGEPITFTGTNASNDLTQGFHQDFSTVTSIEDLAPNINFSVFPNPVTRELTIQLDEAAGTFVASLVDMNGKLVRERTIRANQREQMNVADIADGIYFLRLLSEDNHPLKTFKISKKD